MKKPARKSPAREKRPTMAQMRADLDKTREALLQAGRDLAAHADAAKKQAEADAAVISRLTSSCREWQLMLNNAKTIIEQQDKRIAELTERERELETEIDAQRKQIASLTRQVEEARNESNRVINNAALELKQAAELRARLADKNVREVSLEFAIVEMAIAAAATTRKHKINAEEYSAVLNGERYAHNNKLPLALPQESQS